MGTVVWLRDLRVLHVCTYSNTLCIFVRHMVLHVAFKTVWKGGSDSEMLSIVWRQMPRELLANLSFAFLMLCREKENPNWQQQSSSQAVGPSSAARPEMGTQTLQAVMTEAEWKVLTKQNVEKTVEMTVSARTAPVQAMIGQLQKLQQHKLAAAQKTIQSSFPQTATNPIEETQPQTCFSKRFWLGFPEPVQELCCDGGPQCFVKRQVFGHGRTQNAAVGQIVGMLVANSQLNVLGSSSSGWRFNKFLSNKGQQ